MTSNDQNFGTCTGAARNSGKQGTGTGRTEPDGPDALARTDSGKPGTGPALNCGKPGTGPALNCGKPGIGAARPERDGPEVLARLNSELDLVDLNARQIARGIGRGLALSNGASTLDDLRSFGHEGLLHAARTFDAARGVPFRRWANLRIRGAIIDGMRRWGALPRRTYRELRALSAADALQEVYDEEDAANPALDAESADARLTAQLAGLATAMAIGALAAPPARADGEPASPDATPEDLAIKAQLMSRVRAIVSDLPDAERTLIERHYFADETLDRAAGAIGLSRSWGSRLHARAIEAIAQELRESDPAHADSPDRTDGAADARRPGPPAADSPDRTDGTDPEDSGAFRRR